MSKFDKFIQNNILREIRLKAVAKVIDTLDVKNILDIGCMDLKLSTLINPYINYQGIDIQPAEYQVRKMSVEDLDNKKYDLVLACEVLEHLKDPVLAIKKIQIIASKYILITVPNEPYFSLCRCLIPAKEHLWTIFPQTLKLHLGKPIFEELICFNRHYLGVWKK